MLSAPLAGCFGSQEEGLPSSEDLQISGDLVGGDWSVVTLSVSNALSVYIPYFVVDPGSLRAQNGTVLDLNAGDSQDVRWLLPPRNSVAMLLIGEYARTDWPVRAANESWLDWSLDASNGGSITTIPNEDNGTWNWLGAHDSDGGPVTVVQFETVRPQRSDLTMDGGVDASAGWVDGRSVYDWVAFMTDETPCSDVITCGSDGAVGYLDRWIGNQNPSYEEAIDYFEGVFTGFGLRAEVHRYWTGTCLLYTSPSPRDKRQSRMPSSA